VPRPAVDCFDIVRKMQRVSYILAERRCNRNHVRKSRRISYIFGCFNLEHVCPKTAKAALLDMARTVPAIRARKRVRVTIVGRGSVMGR